MSFAEEEGMAYFDVCFGVVLMLFTRCLFEGFCVFIGLEEAMSIQLVGWVCCDGRLCVSYYGVCMSLCVSLVYVYLH